MNKQEFFNSVTRDTIADETFCKRVYGYSLYDRPFLSQITSKLIECKNIKAMKAYNEWLKIYLEEERQQAKEVAEWYRKFLNEKSEKEEREWKKNQTQIGKSYSDSLMKRIENLQKKKNILEQMLCMKTEDGNQKKM
ncbi:hypothetical protein AALB81_19380 [Lachnospiraceae bacterium 48-33]